MPRSNVQPKKSLGQNFLVDDNIARNIVGSLALSSEDVVVEIGPGLGALTKLIAGKVAQLIAVEIDQRVVGDLRAAYSSSNVSVLHGDFLEYDLFAPYRALERPLRLIGNIPYNLTSEILVKAFDSHTVLRDCTLMVQREVGRRLTAPPGSKQYGILSVYSRFYGVIRTLFPVSRNCFFPKPNVDSMVIQVRFTNPLPYPADEQLFRTVVRTSFGKRRKTLRNALRYLPYTTSAGTTLAERHGDLMDKRPEQLDVEHYVALTHTLAEHLHAASI